MDQPLTIWLTSTEWINRNDSWILGESKIYNMIHGEKLLS